MQSKIMVHFLPTHESAGPARIAPIKAPIANNEPIQEPVSSSKETGRVQLFVLFPAPLTLQSTRKGSAGDVHPRPVPRPKAPIVAVNN